jgi:aryl-alcohol dehydrogenase-like predicted oxidoreductase
MAQQIALRGTSLRVSPLGLGTADWTRPSPTDLDRLYTTFRQAGGNCFDSAHCYAFWIGQEGMPERLLGQLVRKHESRRDDVVICTKGCHITGGEKYPRPERYMTPQLLDRDVADSLERLAMDRIDLYYLHRDDPAVPVDEIMDALNGHIRAGRLGHIGCSNWRAPRIEQANTYARGKGLRPFAASQILWNLGHLSHAMPADICAMDAAEQAYYQRTGLPVFAFSSTANGYFNGAGKSYDNPTSQARRERATELARKLGASANQMALAYLMSHDFPAVPLLGTTKLDHLADALGAMKLKLTAEQVRWLRDG